MEGVPAGAHCDERVGAHATAAFTPRHGKKRAQDVDSRCQEGDAGRRYQTSDGPNATADAPPAASAHQHPQQQRFTTANHDSLCPMSPRPVVSRASTLSYRRLRARSLARASSPSHTARRAFYSIASIQTTRCRGRRPRRLRVRPAHSAPANTHAPTPDQLQASSSCIPKASAVLLQI